MGAEFLLYAAPIPADTSEEALAALVAALPADRLAVVCDTACYDLDEGEDYHELVRSELVGLLCRVRRDVTVHRGEIVTGGMSWGDWPTDAAQPVLLLALLVDTFRWPQQPPD